MYKMNGCFLDIDFKHKQTKNSDSTWSDEQKNVWFVILNMQNRSRKIKNQLILKIFESINTKNR